MNASTCTPASGRPSSADTTRTSTGGAPRGGRRHAPVDAGPEQRRAVAADGHQPGARQIAPKGRGLALRDRQERRALGAAGQGVEHVSALTGYGGGPAAQGSALLVTAARSGATARTGERS